MNRIKRFIAVISLTLTVALMAAGCGSTGETTTETTTVKETTAETTQIETTEAETAEADSSAEKDKTDDSDDADEEENEGPFSDRDMEQEVDLADAETITLSDGQDVEITSEGVYVITGDAENVTIKVDAADEKVQIVLDGVNITNSDSPAIYVAAAKKVWVTTTEDSENSLSVTGTFQADGETNLDGVIFAKDDLVLNGLGTLNIDSTDNGIVAKDDLKVTGGTYNVTAADDGFEVQDEILICDGTFTVDAGKDGFHAEDDDDDTKGPITISGGTFVINAAKQGLQATTVLTIDGGTFNITATEGMEATYIQINGGDIYISASDDGLNASANSTAYDVIIEFNGGTTTIVMGAGDTDGVDANGSIIVNGGTIDVTGNSTFDWDVSGTLNGGTVIVNGQQVTELPQSQMGGRGGRK